MLAACMPSTELPAASCCAALCCHVCRKEMWRSANAEGSTVLVIPTLPTNAL